MVSEEPTRKIVKELRDAGWRILRSDGRHTNWISPNGATFPLPDSHRTISPGVVRKVRKAIQDDKEAR